MGIELLALRLRPKLDFWLHPSSSLWSLCFPSASLFLCLLVSCLSYLKKHPLKPSASFLVELSLYIIRLASSGRIRAYNVLTAVWLMCKKSSLDTPILDLHWIIDFSHTKHSWAYRQTNRNFLTLLIGKWNSPIAWSTTQQSRSTGCPWYSSTQPASASGYNLT